MARVTAVDVRVILDTELTDAQIDAYAASSSALVEASGLSTEESLLKEIERWLTAHLIAISRDPQLTEGKAGPASAKFLIEGGLGLNGSTFGQHVRILDPSGKLDELSSGKTRALIEAI